MAKYQKNDRDANHADGIIHSILKFLGMFILSIVLIMLLIPSASSFRYLLHDTVFKREKIKLENFTEQQYNELFNKDGINEDSVLIVYVVYDYHKHIEVATLTGKNVPQDFKDLLTRTYLKRTMEHQEPYTATLDRKINSVLTWLYINSLSMDKQDVGQAYVKNYSDLQINDNRLKDALERITTTIGGDAAVVIVESRDIYGNFIILKNIFILVLVMLFIRWYHKRKHS
jgi:hypothetical protein